MDLPWKAQAQRRSDRCRSRDVSRRRGTSYIRDDTQSEASFKTVGETSDEDFPHKLVEQVGDDALVALALRADDLEPTPAPDGDTVYRASATAGQVEDAVPTAPGRASGGAWERRVGLEIGVGDDGLIERVVTASKRTTMTTEYLDLGKRQVIERP